ncbi:MAG: hypothetical protein ACKOGE_08400 [Actinomycetota bacterium]
MHTNRQPTMSSREMVDACMKHSLFSWSATGKVDPIPVACGAAVVAGVMDCAPATGKTAG